MKFNSNRLFVLLGLLVLTVASGVAMNAQTVNATTDGRQMERLDRGVVAVKTDQGIFVSWRIFGTEGENVSYNLYRDGVKLNAKPLTVGNYLDEAGKATATYRVAAVIDGKEQPQSAAVPVWSANYLSVPLKVPAGGKTPDGVAYTYSANDCSIGDLDGDHQYEIIVKWDPSNSKDNSQRGCTGHVYLDAYKLDGTLMWRIDLGPNIRAGAHYTQFSVYDLDGDGKAEVACRTADGTIDGQGQVIGEAGKDYRILDSNSQSYGYVLSGPEYLTVFDGETGAVLDTVDFEPARGEVNDWGDTYGNRVDRFLAGVAYLDGKRPSLITTRGYYVGVVDGVTRGQTGVAAWDYQDGKLVQRWHFKAIYGGENSDYVNQGSHSLSAGDVDRDGKDEIVYGACVIDDDGTGLYSSKKEHGDALHLGDLDPNRPGLEIWQCFEHKPFGAALRDAGTGEIIFTYGPDIKDTGRACTADLDPRYPGEELWATRSPLYSSTGVKLGSPPPSCNFAIWWDGDLLRELLDHKWDNASKTGVGTIDKWDYLNHRPINLLTARGTLSNNGTKGTPCLQGDILGDWREEVIWRTEDSSALRIYTTTDVTEYRLYMLMHDPVYRLAIAWQNSGYNQPPHTGFYLGDGLSVPPLPDIYLAP